MRPIGYKESENTKNKRKETLKKWWRSPEGLLKKKRLAKKLIERTKGKTYEQIYGDKATEIKNKIGNGQRGIPKTDDHNRKNREAHIGKKRKQFSDKWRKNIGLAQRGENGSNWRGGIADDPYPYDWTDDLKGSIRKRDNYMCQMCGIHQDELNYKLHCHHIDYNKKNLNPENLITLCCSCHMKTNYNREYWTNYFNINKYE